MPGHRVELARCGGACGERRSAGGRQGHVEVPEAEREAEGMSLGPLKLG